MTTTETRECAKRPRVRRGQEGINVRHRLHCPTRDGGTCTCQPAYQAQAWSAMEGKQIRKTFPSLTDAKAWRQNTQVGLRQGTVRAPSPTTLNQAASEWLAAARSGVVRTRSGDPYKPSAIRSYQHSLNSHILPRLGSQRLTAISHLMLQDLADQMVATGVSASTIRNAILPLRAIYRRALARNDVAINPTLKLALPAGRVGYCPERGHAALPPAELALGRLLGGLDAGRHRRRAAPRRPGAVAAARQHP